MMPVETSNFARSSLLCATVDSHPHNEIISCHVKPEERANFIFSPSSFVVHMVHTFGTERSVKSCQEAKSVQGVVREHEYSLSFSYVTDNRPDKVHHITCDLGTQRQQGYDCRLS